MNEPFLRIIKAKIMLPKKIVTARRSQEKFVEIDFIRWTTRPVLICFGRTKIPSGSVFTRFFRERMFSFSSQKIGSNRNRSFAIANQNRSTVNEAELATTPDPVHPPTRPSHLVRFSFSPLFSHSFPCLLLRLLGHASFTLTVTSFVNN